MEIKFRASSWGKLMGGVSKVGLTEAQQRLFDELSAKEKLTPKQDETLADLTAKKNAPLSLTAGGRSYVEELVDQQLYGFKPEFSTRATQKGHAVEDDSIELYNELFYKSYSKSESHLSDKYGSGHPDVEDDVLKRIVDIKSPWDKKTFPKTDSQGKNTDYEWQVRRYLMLKGGVKSGWISGEIAYCLVDTPDELIPDWENLDMHDMSDVPDHMRVTRCEVTLTEEQEELMKLAAEAALKYAKEYSEILINKNK